MLGEGDFALPPFWLVWAEHGFPPKYKHETLSGAEIEADRLARLSPGTRFYVLQPTSETVHVSVKVRRFSVPEVPF